MLGRLFTLCAKDERSSAMGEGQRITQNPNAFGIVRPGISAREWATVDAVATNNGYHNLCLRHVSPSAQPEGMPPTDRFTDRVQDYAAARSSYPAAAIDKIPSVLK